MYVHAIRLNDRLDPSVMSGVEDSHDCVGYQVVIALPLTVNECRCNCCVIGYVWTCFCHMTLVHQTEVP